MFYCDCCKCPDEDEYAFACMMRQKKGSKEREVVPGSRRCRTCSEWDKEQRYADTGELCSSIIGTARSAIGGYVKYLKYLENDPRRNYLYHKILKEAEEIEAFIKNEFEPKLWFPIAKQQVEGATSGLIGETKFLKVVTGCMIGRAMISIDDKFPMGSKKGKYNGASISVVTEDGCKEPRMGWSGIAATKDEALALLKDTMDNWQKIEFKSTSVTIG